MLVLVFFSLKSFCQISIKKVFDDNCINISKLEFVDDIYSYILLDKYFSFPLVSNDTSVYLYDNKSNEFNYYSNKPIALSRSIFEDSTNYYFFSMFHLFCGVNKNAMKKDKFIFYNNKLSFMNSTSFQVLNRSNVSNRYKYVANKNSANVVNGSWALTIDSNVFYGYIDKNKRFIAKDTLKMANAPLNVIYNSKYKEIYVLDEKIEFSIFNSKKKKQTLIYKIKSDTNYPEDFIYTQLSCVSNYLLIWKVSFPYNKTSIALLNLKNKKILDVYPPSVINSEVKLVSDRPILCWISNNDSLCFYRIKTRELIKIPLNGTQNVGNVSNFTDFSFNIKGDEISLLMKNGRLVKYSIEFPSSWSGTN